MCVGVVNGCCNVHVYNIYTIYIYYIYTWIYMVSDAVFLSPLVMQRVRAVLWPTAQWSDGIGHGGGRRQILNLSSIMSQCVLNVFKLLSLTNRHFVLNILCKHLFKLCIYIQHWILHSIKQPNLDQQTTNNQILSNRRVHHQSSNCGFTKKSTFIYWSPSSKRNVSYVSRLVAMCVWLIR